MYQGRSGEGTGGGVDERFDLRGHWVESDHKGRCERFAVGEGRDENELVLTPFCFYVFVSIWARRQAEVWENDPNAFVADEDDEAEAYSLRTAAFDLLGVSLVSYTHSYFPRQVVQLFSLHPLVTVGQIRKHRTRRPPSRLPIEDGRVGQTETGGGNGLVETSGSRFGLCRFGSGCVVGRG
jgi:hypothetical protein